MTTRRLAAILAADVVGFSGLIGEDEAGTLAALKDIRKTIVNPVLAEHGGRVFKVMGDGLLAEFPSAVQALQAAMGMQQRLRARNAEATCTKPIEVRVGIHQGDVVVEGTDLLGDGVNIAARLEGLAEPGGICISSRVHEDAAGKITLDAQDMGEQNLKNIGRPVRVYGIATGTPDTQRPASPGPERAPLPLPDKPSIAVLPFQNMSGDPEQEYFADGMVEEIITALSRVHSFFVIARNSSFTYKGKAVEVKQVGRELGVRYVLEGSVRKAGGRVRITGQLVEAASGAHLWADRYDGNLDDIFDLQDRVTRSVVAAIAPRLQRAETERALRKPTRDLSAYDMVLRALRDAWSISPERNATALDLLQKAAELDQEYAAAFATVSYCILLRKASAWPVWRSDQDQICLRFAKEALRLDQDDPTVLWMSGAALGLVNRQSQYALELIDRSLAIDPNSAMAWSMKGLACSWVGRANEGIVAVQTAMRLSPLDPLMFMFWACMAECYGAAGKPELQIEAAHRALREAPNPIPGTLRGLAVSYARLGRLDEARAVVKQVMALTPDFTIAKWLQATAKLPQYRPRTVEAYRLAGFPE
jgi:adenylate cyclase